MIDRSLFAAFIIAVAVIIFILDIATKGKYATRKTRVAFLIIGLILGFVYVSGGTQDAQPWSVLDVLTLLMMTSLLIWGIRKRRGKKSIAIEE